MKVFVLSCFLVATASSLQAQGLIKYAFERLGNNTAGRCQTIRGLCAPALLKAQATAPAPAQTERLTRVLQQQAQTARRHYALWSGVRTPAQADERELFPLARAAALTLHPAEPSARALSERWFKKHAHYAQIYARQKNGTAADMLRYFVAKLYADCLVNKTAYPAYQTLENILAQKFPALDYKTCYKEDL